MFTQEIFKNLQSASSIIKEGNQIKIDCAGVGGLIDGFSKFRFNTRESTGIRLIRLIIRLPENSFSGNPEFKVGLSVLYEY